MDANDPFKKLLSESKEFYQSIGKVKCPALNAEVYFTSEGFHHLRYDRSLKERSKLERRNKLSHIAAAVETIKLSSTIQDYRVTLETAGLKDAQGLRTIVKVHYYAFWAVLNKKTRVKAIVRQVENGQYNFWSVMPYWTEINGHKVFGSARMSGE